MKTAAIIAELNPLHRGHARLFDAARAAGYDRVAVILSGDGVQRGDFPLFSPSLRTRAALLAGADLVVELPAPYALQSAQNFARAGVRAAVALGADGLVFGTEGAVSGQALLDGAKALSGENAVLALRQALSAGAPYPAAMARALAAAAPDLAFLTTGPNNILALEYARAVAMESIPLALCPLPRKGEAGAAPGPGGTGASALRAALAAGDSAPLLAAAPKAVAPLYEEALAAGDYYLADSRFSALVLACMRTARPGELAALAGFGEGLGSAFHTAAMACTTVQELFAAVKTKRYPLSRLRRCTMAALLHMEADLPPLPYVRVLGAGQEGLALLSRAGRMGVLPVSPSLADLAKTGPAAARCAALSARAADLYALLRQTPAPGGDAYTRPFIKV